MSILAERKTKRKWILNPRGQSWSQDSNKFGQKMLEKMGWKTGKGLGAKEDGSTEHIRVSYKNDNKGMGYTEKAQWTETEDSFSQLLRNLNQNSNNSDVLKVNSLAEKAETTKAKINYRKFTRGKDLSRYSEKDLANIFGKKTLVEKPKLEEEEVEQQELNGGNEIGVNRNSALVERGSMRDYFRKKLPNFGKNSFGLRIGNNGVLTKDESGSESEGPSFGFGYSPTNGASSPTDANNKESSALKERSKKRRHEESFVSYVEENVGKKKSENGSRKNKKQKIENFVSYLDESVQMESKAIKSENNELKKRRKHASLDAEKNITKKGSRKSNLNQECDDNNLVQNEYENSIVGDSNERALSEENNGNVLVHNEEMSITAEKNNKKSNKLKKTKKRKTGVENTEFVAQMDVNEIFIEEFVKVAKNKSKKIKETNDNVQFETIDGEKETTEQIGELKREEDISKSKKKKSKKNKNNESVIANELEDLKDSSRKENEPTIENSSNTSAKDKKKKSNKHFLNGNEIPQADTKREQFDKLEDMAEKTNKALKIDDVRDANKNVSVSEEEENNRRSKTKIEDVIEVQEKKSKKSKKKLKGNDKEVMTKSKLEDGIVNRAFDPMCTKITIEKHVLSTIQEIDNNPKEENSVAREAKELGIVTEDAACDPMLLDDKFTRQGNEVEENLRRLRTKTKIRAESLKDGLDNPLFKMNGLHEEIQEGEKKFPEAETKNPYEVKLKKQKSKKRKREDGIENPCFNGISQKEYFRNAKTVENLFEVYSKKNKKKTKNNLGVDNPTLNVSDTPNYDLLLNAVNLPTINTDKKRKKNVRFSDVNEEKIIPNNDMTERNELFEINTEIVEKAFQEELNEADAAENGFINNGFDSKTTFDIRSIDSVSFFEKSDGRMAGIDNACFDKRKINVEEKVLSISKTLENYHAELENDLNEIKNSRSQTHSSSDVVGEVARNSQTENVFKVSRKKKNNSTLNISATPKPNATDIPMVQADGNEEKDDYATGTRTGTAQRFQAESRGQDESQNGYAYGRFSARSSFRSQRHDDMMVGDVVEMVDSHRPVLQGVKLSFKRAQFQKNIWPAKWDMNAGNPSKKSYKHLIRGDVIVAFKSTNLHEVAGYGVMENLK